MKKPHPRVAIIGATGMVGRELMRILEDRSFKMASLELFASKNSSGETMDFAGDQLVVKELTDPEQIKADIAFFAAGSKVSLTYIDKASQNGVICIDKSSAYRLRENVPLVVPEVNGHVLKNRTSNIIASPNCVATPLVQVLSPIHKAAKLKHVVVSTYQAVSGAGQRGSDELETQVRDLFNLRDVETEFFGRRIAFNVLPFIPARGSVDSSGRTEEEAKVAQETQKILDHHDLMVDVTCVRVPVFNGHSLSVNIATEDPIPVDVATQILGKAPGIMLIDNPEKQSYPTPLDACGEDVTLVGRIRTNNAAKNGLSLWITSDNLRTGAALNAVRIAETITVE